MDFHEFYTGKTFEAHEFLGAHLANGGVVFRTFAPNAEKISLIGNFSNWQEIEMGRLADRHFFECFVPDAKVGMMYKYRIFDRQGNFVDHCDPYGFGMELRPNTASIIRNTNCYWFNDEKWISQRSTYFDKPLSIYEVHLGSWKKGDDPNNWFTYTQIAEQLIPYVLKNRYNFIEILPLSEHPVDASWGYQNTGYFSPTSRYGSVDELMMMIDMFHQNNIGVIIDFVPAHFAIDDYALANYDGTHLYEYPHPDVGNSEWGSCNFIHSRGEVRSFLQSAAYFWLSKLHFDGIRLDALSNIVYWQGNQKRGINGNAVDFIKVMNKGLKERLPSALLIAEDSTNFPGVTKPVEDGGLGFDYKWNMGWMNDTLSLFGMSPKAKAENYNKLTFSMTYFYNERFLLPFSHDEVVHCKGSIVNKMYGNDNKKYKLAKLLYMYMFAHPGKKLNFMGNEIGQLKEWDENKSVDWDILNNPENRKFNQFITDLNELYINKPALSKDDYSKHGFEWIDCNQKEKVLYIFKRVADKHQIVVVLNLSNNAYNNYEINLDNVSKAEIIFTNDSDNCVLINGEGITLNIMPLSAMYIEV